MKDVSQFLLGFSIASVQAGLIYGAFREIEKRKPKVILILLGIQAFLLSFSILFLAFFVFTVLVLTLPILIGEYLHRWSGGASKDSGEALQLMAVVMGCNYIGVVFSGVALLGARGSNTSIPDSALFGYFLTGLIFPPIVPVGWQLWNSTKVRPGIDAAFETEREALP